MQAILSFVRTLLIAIGAFLVGKTIFNETIGVDNWASWVGTLMVIAGGVWSWITKALPEDQKLSLVRTILASVGAIVVSAGKVDVIMWTNITGVAVILATFILGRLNKNKDNKVADGKIAPQELRKP